MVSVSGFRSWRPEEMGRHDSTRSILYDPRCFGAGACHDRSGSSSTTTSLPLELTRTPMGSIHDGPLPAVPVDHDLQARKLTRR